MASSATRGVVGGLTKIKAKDTTGPFIALLIFVAGGFYAMRAQQKSSLTVAPTMPETMPPGLRHRVDMAHRMDQARLREWLAEKEAAAGAAGPTEGGAPPGAEAAAAATPPVPASRPLQ